MLWASPAWKHTTFRRPSPQPVTQHLPGDAAPDYLRSRHSHPIRPPPLACFNVLLCISWSYQHTVDFPYVFPFCLSLPHESRGGESHALFSTVPPVPRADFPNTHTLNKSSTSCGKPCHHLQRKDEGTEAQWCHEHAQGWTIPKQWQRQDLTLSKQTSLCPRYWVLGTPYQLCHVNFWWHFQPAGTILYPVVDMSAEAARGSFVHTDGKQVSWDSNPDNLTALY